MIQLDFQAIFDELQSILPSTWNKMVFFAGYTEGSYSMKYYICGKDGRYVDCFSQESLSKAQLLEVFERINKIIVTERDTLDAEHRWTVLTMIVDHAGNMKTEFDYADISENSIAYKKMWKKKYLL